MSTSHFTLDSCKQRFVSWRIAKSFLAQTHPTTSEGEVSHQCNLVTHVEASLGIVHHGLRLLQQKLKGEVTVTSKAAGFVLTSTSAGCELLLTPKRPQPTSTCIDKWAQRQNWDCVWWPRRHHVCMTLRDVQEDPKCADHVCGTRTDMHVLSGWQHAWSRMMCCLRIAILLNRLCTYMHAVLGFHHSMQVSLGPKDTATTIYFNVVISNCMDSYVTVQYRY